MRCIIYKYTNKYNNKIYIGQTTNEEKRREAWLNPNTEYAGNYINRARKKYGINAFLYDILAEINIDDKNMLKEMLNVLEKYYISFYKCKNEKFGYNLSDGGRAGVGQIFTDSTRKKMSEVQKGIKKPMSEKGKKNISLAHRGPRPWRYKKVCQIDKNTNEIIKIWESLSAAAKHFGDNNVGNLAAAIKNKNNRKYYRGFKWLYYGN